MTEIEKFIAQGFYFELLPVFVLGFCVGFSKYLDPENSDNKSISTAFFHGFSGLIVCFIIYAILDSTNLSYLTRTAIACAVAFYGIDKALDIAHKFLALRGGGGNIHQAQKTNPPPTQTKNEEE